MDDRSRLYDAGWVFSFASHGDNFNEYMASAYNKHSPKRYWFPAETEEQANKYLDDFIASLSAT